jgi:hypothetical protein
LPRISIPFKVKENESIDVCKRCYDPTMYDGHPDHPCIPNHSPEADVWHPAYSEEDYKCQECGKPLTDEDN